MDASLPPRMKIIGGDAQGFPYTIAPVVHGDPISSQLFDPGEAGRIRRHQLVEQVAQADRRFGLVEEIIRVGRLPVTV